MAARPIKHSKESVLAIVPAKAPGMSIRELNALCPEMSSSALRDKIRELVDEKLVVRFVPPGVIATPLYHAAPLPPSSPKVEV